MRVHFSVPNEPPAELCQAISATDACDPDKLKRKLFAYLVSEDRPQTYVLPRSILRETIETSIAHMMNVAKEFPQFELGTDATKFVKCRYETIWRALLTEWKVRLIVACGKRPCETERPRDFDPWIDIGD
jgi:hypothetical protein